jgi:DNA-binding MarR family transcriptional regulator
MEVTPKQVSDEIMALIHNFKADIADVAEGCHLTKTQMMALHAISDKNEIPMGQMAEVLHCDPSNVTGIVDRMVGQGLIVREKSPKDRRTKIIRLTDKGKQFIKEVELQIPVRLGCDQLDASDRMQLCGLLKKLNGLHRTTSERCTGHQTKSTTAL